MASKGRNVFYQDKRQEIDTFNLPSFCGCMSYRHSEAEYMVKSKLSEKGEKLHIYEVSSRLVFLWNIFQCLDAILSVERLGVNEPDWSVRARDDAPSSLRQVGVFHDIMGIWNRVVTETGIRRQELPPLAGASATGPQWSHTGRLGQPPPPSALTSDPHPCNKLRFQVDYGHRSTLRQASMRPNMFVVITFPVHVHCTTISNQQEQIGYGGVPSTKSQDRKWGENVGTVSFPETTAAGSEVRFAGNTTLVERIRELLYTEEGDIKLNERRRPAGRRYREEKKGSLREEAHRDKEMYIYRGLSHGVCHPMRVGGDEKPRRGRTEAARALCWGQKTSGTCRSKPAAPEADESHGPRDHTEICLTLF
ncbi:hypothetical protein AAG570_010051 [Ranatra chinensis]|uniref:Uncharacterized protein n=1 Tax=Ranatra chinensis TaxID=642074 RepID=A0ABD0YLE9_9HEMI